MDEYKIAASCGESLGKIVNDKIMYAFNAENPRSFLYNDEIVLIQYIVKSGEHTLSPYILKKSDTEISTNDIDIIDPEEVEDVFGLGMRIEIASATREDINKMGRYGYRLERVVTGVEEDILSALMVL